MMGELNDMRTEKLVKTESQFRAMCDLSDMQMETLHEQEQAISELQKTLELIADIAFDYMETSHEQEQAISELQKTLELIADIAFDYDGANTVEGLKSLIDEIREIAIKGVQNADHSNMDTQ